MSNSDQFLSAYSGIDKYLRYRTGRGKGESFSKLVEVAAQSDRRVQRFAIDLKEFADLRNAIVHERTDEHVIAEPNTETVDEIQRLEQLLLKPPQVIPLFQIKNVFTLEASRPIADAVIIMEKESFSQVPIYDSHEFAGLLTTNTVARWLGASVEEEIFSLTETSINDVLVHTEDPDHCAFLSRNSDVFEVIERFRHNEQRGKRLEALIITQNGSVDEKPLGLITTYDLPKIQEAIDYRSRSVK